MWGRHKQKHVPTIAVLTFANMLIKDKFIQRREVMGWIKYGWKCKSVNAKVSLIVTVVNDVPIKNHLSKWFSIPRIMRRKIGIEAILCKLTTNINLRVLWASFLADSILQKLEFVAVSKKKFLVLILALPLIFIALRGNCIFSHFKRSAIFICPECEAIQFKTACEECWSESHSSVRCK